MSLAILIALPFFTMVLLIVGLWPSITRWFNTRAEHFQEFLDEYLWEDITGVQLAAYTTSSMFAGFVLGYLIFGGVVVPWATMWLGYKLPYWIVRYQINARHQLLEQQLELGLQQVANSMRAGLTFIMALKESARNLPGPISNEFSLIAKEYELGKTLDQALKDSRHRFKSQNYDLAVLSILVSRQQGGNLSETLERIGAFMREIFALDRKVRVLTSEGRFSAKIIGLSPVFMATMMYLGAPETIEPLFTDPVGGFILFSAVTINLIAFAWIQKIVELKV